MLEIPEMLSFDSIFSEEEQQSSYPLLRYIDEKKPDSVSVEVDRSKDLLGYRSAKLVVSLTINGDRQPSQEYLWDDELNLALVKRGYRSISLADEKKRFVLMLKSRLRTVETRFGDGFFNAVLVHMVREGALMKVSEVADVMKDVFANEPCMSGSSYGDCRNAITQVLRTCANDLSMLLGYDRDEAEEILAGAIARYLDERFTVTDRRRLGWT